MKEPKPVTFRDSNQKPKKGTQQQTNDRKPSSINHEFTEQISLTSSDQNDSSDSKVSTKGSTKGSRVFSSKSMSEIIKGDQKGLARKRESGSHMEETSSCSFHEEPTKEMNKDTSKDINKDKNVNKDKKDKDTNRDTRSKDTRDEQKSVSLSELSENIRSRTELLTPTKETKDSKISKTKDSKISKTKDSKNKQIEIKRLKLISFLGNRINETPIEEIEEAISKMLFLTTQQFENLLEDVLRQIEERTHGRRGSEKTNSLSSFSSKQSESKLVHLNAKQFKKLCLDVFYVFEAKYPSNKTNKYSELIRSLENSLKEMTSKMSMLDETEEVIFGIENERISSKQLSIFLDYVKKVFLSHNLETEVLIKFEEVYFRNFDCTNLCLDLLNPEFLLNLTHNSFDMKIQAQRKIVYSIYKKYKKSIKKSKKLESPYKYLLRKEVVNLILLLESKKPTMKEVLKNLSVLFDHLTFCCLNEGDVFSKEAFLLFKCVIKSLEEMNEMSLEEMFVEFDEFNLKIKEEKLGKRVLNDELERLIVNLARKVLELN